jgi:glycosyltransferase involved in cell wall biosynthesis
MITGLDVSVVIPSLPDRASSLERAVASVERQSARPAAIVTHIDHDRAGAHVARNAALAKVTTPWVAFLDDDDQFHANHLATLIDGANKSGADVIGTYPQSDPPTMRDALVCCYKGIPVTGSVGIPWGRDQLDHFDSRQGRICPHCRTPRGSFIMVTNLVRMDLVNRVGGFPAPGSMGSGFAGSGAEDYLFLLALLDAGARFHHVPGVRTWTYRPKG